MGNRIADRKEYTTKHLIASTTKSIYTSENIILTPESPYFSFSTYNKFQKNEGKINSSKIDLAFAYASNTEHLLSSTGPNSDSLNNIVFTGNDFAQWARRSQVRFSKTNLKLSDFNLLTEQQIIALTPGNQNKTWITNLRY